MLEKVLLESSFVAWVDNKIENFTGCCGIQSQTNVIAMDLLLDMIVNTVVTEYIVKIFYLTFVASLDSKLVIPCNILALCLKI